MLIFLLYFNVNISMKYTLTGCSVLQQTGPISLTPGHRCITRDYSGRTQHGQHLGAIPKKVNQLSSLKSLPPNVQRGQLGDTETMRDLFNGLSLAMATGVLCVHMVPVLLFQGFLQPATILAALPLSAGGALPPLSSVWSYRS